MVSATFVDLHSHFASVTQFTTTFQEEVRKAVNGTTIMAEQSLLAFENTVGGRILSRRSSFRRSRSQELGSMA